MRVKDIEKKSRGVPHTSTKVLIMSMTESATSVAVDGGAVRRLGCVECNLSLELTER